MFVVRAVTHAITLHKILISASADIYFNDMSLTCTAPVQKSIYVLIEKGSFLFLFFFPPYPYTNQRK